MKLYSLRHEIANGLVQYKVYVITYVRAAFPPRSHIRFSRCYGLFACFGLLIPRIKESSRLLYGITLFRDELTITHHFNVLRDRYVKWTGTRASTRNCPHCCASGFALARSDRNTWPTSNTRTSANVNVFDTCVSFQLERERDNHFFQ